MYVRNEQKIIGDVLKKYKFRKSFVDKLVKVENYENRMELRAVLGAFLTFIVDEEHKARIKNALKHPYSFHMNPDWDRKKAEDLKNA